MSKYGNVLTGARADYTPQILTHSDGAVTHRPTWAQLCAAGWRSIVEVQQVVPGFRVTRWELEDIDGATCREIIADQVLIADEQAAAEAAQAAAEKAEKEHIEAMLDERFKKIEERLTALENTVS